MPPIFVEVPDVAEFTVYQRLNNQDVLNSYHVKKEGGWDSASLATMCVVFISWMNDDLAPNLSHEIQFIKVAARDLTTAAGAIAEVNFPSLSGGDDPGPAVPNQDTLAVAHTTGVAGRSYRGRTSVSGIPREYAVNNVWNSGMVGSVVDAFDALDAAINTAGGTYGIVSRYSGYTQVAPKYKKVPTPRAEGIFTDIINNSAGVRIGSQDSRNN